MNNKNQEVNLENLEVSVEQAEVIKDDELKTVTGGTFTYIAPSGRIDFCQRH